MAITAEGADLTQQHRKVQMGVRALLIQRYAQLWPVWKGDEASFQRLLVATLPLIISAHELSSAIAASYFEHFRAAEGILGTASPVRATELDQAKVLGTLHLTGAEMTRDALAGGKSPKQAMDAALIRTSGTAGRFSLQGGRETIVKSSQADPKAKGWTRVTSDTPCAFCALLSARGPVYSSDTVDFEAHDHCSCAGEPYFPGSEWPGRGKEFREIYRRASRGDDVRRGTSNDLLNAFRRELAAVDAPGGRQPTEPQEG